MLGSLLIWQDIADLLAAVIGAAGRWAVAVVTARLESTKRPMRCQMPSPLSRSGVMGVRPSPSSTMPRTVT